MRAETLILLAGIYTSVLAVFHLTFWRIFRWKGQLAHLHPVNRGVMQVLNLCLTFLFFVVAYLCFFHAGELVGTALGRTLLAALTAFLIFRTVLQLLFFSARVPLSWVFVGIFLVGGSLFGAPLLM